MRTTTGLAMLAAAGLSLMAAPRLEAQPAAKAATGTHEITVTIQRLRALDKLDANSKADFLARVTIGDRVQEVNRVRESDDIRPNWRFTHALPPGVHPIRIEVFDKDVTRNEPIDINRVANKRQQDFTIDTRTCRIQGFSGLPRCGVPIVRAGVKPKKAQITFTVSVKK